MCVVFASVFVCSYVGVYVCMWACLLCVGVSAVCVVWV